VGFNKKVQESIHLAGMEENNYLTKMEEVLRRKGKYKIYFF